eukprot:gene5821-9644_t
MENEKEKEKILCQSELSLITTSKLGLKTSKKYHFYLVKQTENKEIFLRYEKIKASNIWINDYKIEKNTTINFDFDVKKKKFVFFIILNASKNLELNSNDLKESELWKKSFEKCKISIKSRVKTKSTPNQSTLGLKFPHIFNSSNVSEDDARFHHSFEEFIELHHFTHWNVSYTLDWIVLVLSLTENKEDVKHVQEIFMDSEINGSILDLLDEGILKRFGVKQSMIPIVLKVISELKLSKSFDFATYKIANKLKKTTKSNDLDQIFELSKSLATEKSLRNTYLSTNDESVYKLVKQLKETLKTVDSTDENEQNISNEILFEKKLKVKLVITNIKTNETLRKIFSPFINFAKPKSFEYGLFHTALIVGPFYLEWNDSSLCIPKKVMKSHQSFFSVDIQEIPILNSDLTDLVKSLSKIICEWNINYEYKSNPMSQFEGSCQNFVDAILQELNLKFSFEQGGCLNNYIKKMKKYGTYGAVFTPSLKFEKYFSITSTITFESHEQLDKFVLKLLEKDKNLKFNFNEEYCLLKAFDRGFWLKSFASTFNLYYQSLTINEKIACPFENPTGTGSFIEMPKYKK